MTREFTLPLFRLGFRPFFLGGALLALFTILVWTLALLGYLHWRPAGGWLAWHRHEMIFGFGAAIIAGFLLTAVQNWTGIASLRGWPLALLVALWLAGRILWLTDAPPWLLSPVDLAFLPALAVAIGRSLLKARQRRNYPVLGIIVALAVGNLLVHMALHFGNDQFARQGNLGALWLIAALIGLIGGRIIPMFTRNGLQLGQLKAPLAWLDNALLILGLLAALSLYIGAGLRPNPASGMLFLILGAGHTWRLLRWYNQGIWTAPLVWSLHLAYAWLAVACFAMAGWHAGWPIGFSQATHLLAIGAMAGIILAMIARVSLGHTGRPLQAPRAMLVAFVLINIAVPARVWLFQLHAPIGLSLASAAWVIAFGLFVWHYGPILGRPRPDGRPG